MYALALLGCTDPLVVERIIGVDIASVVYEGTENARLGASVAYDGRVAATAPGVGCVELDGEGIPGPSQWVGFVDGEVARAGDGELWLGEARHDAGTARAFAAGDTAVFLGGTAGVWTVPGGPVDIAVAAVEALAVDGSRLATRSRDAGAGGCRVVLWSLAETTPSGEEVSIPCSADGALAFVDGALCAGDPELADDVGTGTVGCDDGRAFRGEPGDHLGRAIGGGYAAGSFNKWLVPGLARLVPLRGGPLLALEEGAENQPHALAGDAGTLVVGAPYYAAGSLPTGAVFVVALP